MLSKSKHIQNPNPSVVIHIYRNRVWTEGTWSSHQAEANQIWGLVRAWMEDLLETHSNHLEFHHGKKAGCKCNKINIYSNPFWQKGNSQPFKMEVTNIKFSKKVNSGNSDSPSFFSHFTMLPSSIVGDSAGMKILIAGVPEGKEKCINLDNSILFIQWNNCNKPDINIPSVSIFTHKNVPWY